MKTFLYSIFFFFSFKTIAQTKAPFVLALPAINQAGSNDTINGNLTGVNIKIERINLSGNRINFRTRGVTSDALILSSNSSTNWTEAGTDPVFATVPTYIRFDSRDAYGSNPADPFLPFSERYRLRVTYSPAVLNPIINISGTANRILRSDVSSTIITSSLRLNGSQGGNGGALPLPVLTSITNGAQMTGSHGSDRFNVALRLN